MPLLIRITFIRNHILFSYLVFLVVRQNVFTSTNEKIVTGGVSEWIIAVIVVGLASLMFVIAFGTTVVMRQWPLS
jgi:hypothetical protein